MNALGEKVSANPNDRTDVRTTQLRLGVCEKDKKKLVGGVYKEQYPYYVPSMHGLGFITDKSPLWVLDLDRFRAEKHANETQTCGIAWFLRTNNELPKTWIAESPNGGLHIYFRRNDVIRQGQSCFGKEEGKTILADIRANGGHIMCPPTTIEGKAYFWRVPPVDDNGVVTPLASAPQWLIDAYLEAKGSDKKRKRSADDIHVEHQLKLFRVAQQGDVIDPGMKTEVTHVCDLLDPQKRLFERSDWVNVGMALHHGFCGHKAGFDVWKQISQHELVKAKFNEADMVTQYDSFSRPRAGAPAITVRSLYFWAMEDNLWAFNFRFPRPFLDVNHLAFFFEEKLRIGKEIQKVATTHEQVWSVLRQLLIETVGFDEPSNMVFLKHFDPCTQSVVFVPVKKEKFEQSQKSVITWVKASDADGDVDTGDGDCDEDTLTLAKVFANTVFPDLTYVGISVRPFNKNRPESYPRTASAFPGFATARDADRLDALGVEINPKHIARMKWLFRVWAGGTGHDVPFSAPTPSDPHRVMHGDTEDVKKFARDLEYYFAYRWQRPDKPGDVILVISGYSNSKKSLGLSALLSVFGDKHFIKVGSAANYKDSSNYSGHMEDKLFKWLEEANDWVTREVEADLKNADSETVWERVMYSEGKMVPSSLGYVLTTNGMKNFKGDRSSGNRKWKINNASHFYSKGHPQRCFGLPDEDEGYTEADSEFCDKLTGKLVKEMIDDETWKISVARHWEQIQLPKGWAPANMEETPATKAFQKKAADPLLNFLVYLGEEFDDEVILDQTPPTKSCALKNVHGVYEDWCRMQHFRADVLGANDFKAELIGKLEAAGVPNAYAKKLGGPDVPVFNLTKDGIQTVIRNNLDKDFVWTSAV